MKLAEALRITHSARADAPVFRLRLACGFTPLHLQTFTGAFLQLSLPDRRVVIETGLFGDLPGTLSRAPDNGPDATALVVEWSDLDPRLGYRSLGGWSHTNEADIVRQVRATLKRIGQQLNRLGGSGPVAVTMPTLPLPPAFHTAAAHAGASESNLLATVHEAAAEWAGSARIRLVSQQHLAMQSPPAGRLDLKSDLFSGFPYSVPHASAVGHALAQLVAPAAPKKGLITDLDDTLWLGIVGEVGSEAVAWDLNGHGQIHGLYQQTLRALGDQGVLLAVASKNDPAIAGRALERKDLLLTQDRLFPIEIHWQAKSTSVARILSSWNIGAGNVVFVDDSPMEIGEVRAAFPEMECIEFPKQDHAAADQVLRRLRDLFGKAQLSSEDALRMESLRQGARFSVELAESDVSEHFLEGLGATITVDAAAAEHPRSLELINKTNQFNLNGKRITTADWSTFTQASGSLVWAVAYSDKFGPLGRIAVVQGNRNSNTLRVNSWVMSCRAFARRIEHQTLRLLFDNTGVEVIVFDFQATERNGPLVEFLTSVLGEAPKPGVCLTRQVFERSCPPLAHTIEWEATK